MNDYIMDEEFENNAIDLPSPSGKYIIDREIFEKMFIDHDYIEITSLKKYYDSCIKPLILCKDCKKWKTSDCLRITLDEYGFKKRQSKDTLETWTDPDDYCKDGEAK